MVRDQGDIDNFNELWRGRQEKHKSWFYRGEPENQIQYAFGQHFGFLESVVPIKKGDKVLEVGCGRGSFGAFFADYGCRVTLTDLSSEIIEEARGIFQSLGLDRQSDFVVCDALDLKLEEETFDITTSIGLLEHFEDPSGVIKEQMRVLKKGGVFTAYVVPDKWTMTTLFQPVNKVLKDWNESFPKSRAVQTKTPLFRTKYDSSHYKEIMKKLGLTAIGASGVYPYPAISYSPEFPFSLMPPDFEKALVTVFQSLEKMRRAQNKEIHPWACEESTAQGFFIWGTKSEIR